MMQQMMQMTTAVVQALNGLSSGVPPGGGQAALVVRVVEVHLVGEVVVAVLVVFLRRFRMVVEVDRQVDQLRFRMKGRCPST